MKVSTVFIWIMLLAATTTFAATAPLSKMRPYTGIGILLLPVATVDSGDAPLLYEEPALLRQGELNRAKIPPFDWIFGSPSVDLPLIVMARKGPWLRVVYDDAGREAWLTPPRQFTFQPWETFFKGHVSWLLPGLQKKYYQVYQHAGAVPLVVLKNRQPFRVLQFENDWALVLIEQSSLGWLRWRDEDSRLLMGIATESEVRTP